MPSAEDRNLKVNLNEQEFSKVAGFKIPIYKKQLYFYIPTSRK